MLYVCGELGDERQSLLVGRLRLRHLTRPKLALSWVDDKSVQAETFQKESAGGPGARFWKCWPKGCRLGKQTRTADHAA